MEHKNKTDILILYQTIKYRKGEDVKNALINCLTQYYQSDENTSIIASKIIEKIFKDAKEAKDDLLEVNVPLLASIVKREGYVKTRQAFKKYYYLPLSEECNGIFDVSVDGGEGLNTGGENPVIEELVKCDTIISQISNSKKEEIKDDSTEEEKGIDDKNEIILSVKKSLIDELIDARQDEILFVLNLKKEAGASANVVSLESELTSVKQKLKSKENEIVTISQDKKQLEKAKNQAVREKNDAVKENERIQGLLDTERAAHKTTKSELNAKIQENEDLQKKMEKYTSQIVILPQEIVDFAKKCESFFEEYKQLLSDAQKMVGASKKGIDDDDYNYYYMRIMNKFSNSTSGIASLNAYISEISMLAKTGMVYSGGLVDKDCKGKDVNSSVLQNIYYTRLFKNLASAAIIMSDEFAYLLPKMATTGCPDTNMFAKHTEKMIKAITNLGYTIKYSRPFTKVESFAKTNEFTENPNVPSGYVFEVTQMAIEYGTSKLDTLVIAKE